MKDRFTGLRPPDALALPVPEVLELLAKRYGADAGLILQGKDLAPEISPVSSHDSTDWIRRSNMVGINVRTIGSFWRVVHYSLTLPSTMDSIHLLPIWEPGVVGSLYGIASWQLNEEFFDSELAEACPALDTTARQLRAVVDTLHLTGRTVGMEVIPHTDRFSEIVLANPSYFEWLKRSAARITDHRADLHVEVEELIREYLRRSGPAVADDDADADRLFTDIVPEDRRNRILFGPASDRKTRLRRRGEIVTYVHREGYEPVPATMAPPYRGIEVDAGTTTKDDTGDTWVDFRITRPQTMSRVFGPLTRFKLYERVRDNRNWEIDFDRPRTAVWDYVARHYGDVQEAFGFDFMRGDMSHVQMRPDGVPAPVPAHYDIHAHVKRTIARRRPSFAYFAESFLSPPDVIAFGNEVDHLEASEADVTLGDLQSVPVASDDFCRRLRQYLDIASTRAVTPCLTLMTADKDDPRFDEFYLSGNELRLFLGLMLPDMPCYMALGFELRDPHPEPAANEKYSKLYVFQQTSGRNATHGPYQFGGNTGMFTRLRRIHDYAGEVVRAVASADPVWLLPPDATAGHKVIAWRLAGRNPPDRICVCNLDTVAPALNAKVPGKDMPYDPDSVRLEFSSVPNPRNTAIVPSRDGFHVARLGRGECRVYLITPGGRGDG